MVTLKELFIIVTACCFGIAFYNQLFKNLGLTPSIFIVVVPVSCVIIPFVCAAVMECLFKRKRR